MKIERFIVIALCLAIAACAEDVLLGGEVPDASTPMVDAGSDGNATPTDSAANDASGDAVIDAGSDAPTLPSGILDVTFGGKGYLARTGTAGAVFSPNDVAKGVAIDGSGRVLVAGWSDSGNNSYATAWRVRADGGFDDTFGDAGAWFAIDATGNGSSGLGIVSDVSGNAKLTGIVRTSDTTSALGIWGLTTNGTRDAAFGTNGLATAPSTLGSTSDVGYAIAKASGGELVVAGRAVPTSGGSSEDMAAWRYGAGGAPVTSFGTNGFVVASGTAGASPGRDNAAAIAVDANGSIVVGGMSIDAAGHHRAAVWRFTSSGAVDTTFNGSGHALFSAISGNTANPLEDCRAVAVDKQGRIVFVGWTLSPGGDYDGYVGRLTSSGALDTTFGTNGFFVFATPPGVYATVSALAIDSKGRIIVAGGTSESPPAKAAAWRLTNSGALDTTFGANGRWSMSGTAEGTPTGQGDGVQGVALDALERIVLVGYSAGANDGNQAPGTPMYMAVWRLTP